MGRSKVMKTKTKMGKRSSNGSILKYVLVLLVLNSSNEQHCCHSMKLNPAQPLPLLPLIKESESMKASFNQAKELIQAIRNEVQAMHVEGEEFVSTRLPPDDIRTSSGHEDLCEVGVSAQGCHCRTKAQ